MLIVTGRWRVFAAAAATVALLALAVTLAFGVDVWTAFLASTEFTRVVVLEQGGTGWHKMQSVFSWVRMWGGGVTLAYAIQGVVTLAIAAALVWLWRSTAAFPLKAAALVIGCVLATPYSLDYDLMLLAPAIAYLAVDGLARGFGALRKNRAGRVVDRAAGRALGAAIYDDTSRRTGDAAGVRIIAAPRHRRRAAGVFPRAPAGGGIDFHLAPPKQIIRSPSARR